MRKFLAVTITASIGFALLLGPLVAGAQKKSKFDTPTLACAGSTASSINLTVTAGASGAPAGFSVQWMTAADYAAYGWPANSDCPLDINGNPTCSDSFCKASFSGNANGSTYNLAANQAITIQIGDTLYDDPGASSTCDSTPLACGTAYVFRVFAHANSTKNRSDFSANTTCSTIACTGNGGCTLTQGYWKTHGPGVCVSGNNTNTWPSASLMLGSVVYTDAELCSIFNTPAGGNGLISLAHQLMAAKLNVASGADDSSVAGAIAAADALIGGLIVPPVGAGSLPASATSALTATLTSFNEGTIGPGHCP